MAKTPPPPKKKTTKSDPPGKAETKGNLDGKEYMMLRIDKDTHRNAKIKASIREMKLIDYIKMLVENDKVSF